MDPESKTKQTDIKQIGICPVAGVAKIANR